MYTTALGGKQETKTKENVACATALLGNEKHLTIIYMISTL